MFKRQILAVAFSVIIVAILILVPGCGKKDNKTSTKSPNAINNGGKDNKTSTKSPNAIIDKGKTQKLASPNQPENIIIDSSFEKSIIFDSGLYKQAKFQIRKPLGWTTKGQTLKDSEAWTSEESHTGKHSLKIENTGATNAYWEGKPVVLKIPVRALKISIWTKTQAIEEITGQGKFQMELDVYSKTSDGQDIKREIILELPQNNINWKKSQKGALFKENIVKIVPRIRFSDATGTVYIDDLFIGPVNFNKLKTIFDSDVNNKVLESNKSITGKSEQKIYEAKVSQMIFLSDFIPVSKNKIYKLSGIFKSNGTQANKIFFGYVPYNAEKKFITRQSVIYLKNTETELAEPCNKNDTVLYVKNAENWIKGGNVAFNTDNSGKYTDLPNFNLSSNIISINRNGDVWEVELSKPFAKTYPAGTLIREHYNNGAGTYIYNAASNLTIPDKWTECKAINLMGDGELYNHIKYVRIFIICNMAKTKNATLEFKNIRMQETTE